MQLKPKTNKEETVAGSNKDLEGNDKTPGEEHGKAEKVTTDDLKGKKVDADPETDKPLNK